MLRQVQPQRLPHLRAGPRERPRPLPRHCLAHLQRPVQSLLRQHPTVRPPDRTRETDHRARVRAAAENHPAPAGLLAQVRGGEHPAGGRGRGGRFRDAAHGRGHPRGVPLLLRHLPQLQGGGLRGRKLRLQRSRGEEQAAGKGRGEENGGRGRAGQFLSGGAAKRGHPGHVHARGGGRGGGGTGRKRPIAGGRDSSGWEKDDPVRTIQGLGGHLLLGMGEHARGAENHRRHALRRALLLHHVSRAGHRLRSDEGGKAQDKRGHCRRLDPSAARAPEGGTGHGRRTGQGAFHEVASYMFTSEHALK
mmetsp:Transcript_5076/g.10230  ORF Transcript_5076/g.10230 Transcript_5076/m.10230 type:complete len:305 (-) Transcript_5076:280-1194(-)